MIGDFQPQPSAGSLVSRPDAGTDKPGVGKRSLTEQLPMPPDGAAASAGGAGKPLEPALQAKMSAAFGADLSAVRVHEDGRASQMGAVAYAQGTDLHFAPGQYDPHSQRGQEVIGHELSHLLQQRDGRVAAGTPQALGLDVNDDDGLEHEADQHGARAARGESVRAAGAAPVANGGPVQLMKIGGVDSRTMSFDQIVAAQQRPMNAKQRGALIERCQALLGTGEQHQAVSEMILKLQGPAAASGSKATTSNKRNNDHLDDGASGSRTEAPTTKSTSTSNKNKKAKVEPEISFKLSQDKSDATYEEIALKHTGAEAKTPAQATTGYIAQIPTHLGGSSPAAIASQYETQAFDDPAPPAQAVSRLRIAVGVNSYRDVADENRNDVAAMVNTADSKVHAATFGFLWQPMWEKSVPGEHEGEKPAITKMPSSAVLSDPDAADKRKHDPQYFARIEQDKGSGATRQGKVPFGRVRDHIKDHNATAALTAELRAKYANVYVHVGDDDATTLKAKTGQGMPKQGGGEALGLLSRYDEVLAAHQQKTGQLPLLATGGYEFKRVADGGDIPDSSTNARITLIAHQLDRRIREILVAKLGAFAVYFPEPNTIYKVTEANSRLREDDEPKPIFHNPDDTKGGGSAESQQMVKRLREMNKGGAVYDPRASVTTETSSRFKEGENTFGAAVTTGAVDSVLIKHVVGQNQSHASSTVWADAVKQGTADEKPKIPMTFIKAVIETYTVTGNDFNRKSQSEFSAEDIEEFLTETIKNPPAGTLEAKHQKTAKTEIGKQIIAAAQASNTEIVRSIEDTLQLVRAAHPTLTYKKTPKKADSKDEQ